MKDKRADIKKYFNENLKIPNTEEIHYSSDKKYYFKSNYYQQTDKKRNWIVTKIEIFKNDTGEKIFEFIRNDDSIFYGWLKIDNSDYLLLSEDLEGQSIFDIDTRNLYSYSSDDDKFIWCEYYPSPDCKRLAIVGCNWACPYEIRIYDTSEPTSLPYPLIYKRDTFQDKIEWNGQRFLKITNRENKSEMIEIK